jgi:hypothetical protein
MGEEARREVDGRGGEEGGGWERRRGGRWMERRRGGRTHEFTGDDADVRGGGGGEDDGCRAASDSMNMLRSHKRHA